MRPVLAVLLSLGIASCAHRTPPPTVLQTFYRAAKEREGKPDRKSLPQVDLAGLHVELGVLPGTPNSPQARRARLAVLPKGPVEEGMDGVIVSSSDPREPNVVQVIVWPRVSGSMLDSVEPTEEFRREMENSAREALETHCYSGVYLLPKPAKIKSPANTPANRQPSPGDRP